MTHSVNASSAAAQGTADYIVVVSNEEDCHAGYHHFADKVNRKLRAGYQLHGPPFSVSQTLCQAMVRPGGAAHGGDTTMFLQPQAYHH